MEDIKSLSSFIAKVKEGLAVTSQYSVLITKPNNLGIETPSTLTLFCQQTALPSLGFQTDSIVIFGEVRNVPYQKLFGKISLSFYTDANFNVKKFFDKWLDLVIDPVTRLVGFYDDYISTIEIIVDDREGNPVYKVKLHEAYPVTVNSINLSYDKTDVVMVDVSVDYKYYTTEVINSERQTTQTVIPLSNKP